MFTNVFHLFLDKKRVVNILKLFSWHLLHLCHSPDLRLLRKVSFIGAGYVKHYGIQVQISHFHLYLYIDEEMCHFLIFNVGIKRWNLELYEPHKTEKFKSFWQFNAISFNNASLWLKNEQWIAVALSGVARNLRQGVCKVVIPLPSLPPSFPPFPHSPFSPLFPFPLLPLEVDPLNTARGSGGAL